ncbi:MAG: acyltransferase family protein [Janthinobacterium lividum]
MEPTLPKTSSRLHELDLLRFVAALSVLLFHYTYQGYTTGTYRLPAFGALSQVTRYGYLGVQLFFLISGYVVLLSAQGKTVGQLAVSRVVRLYPAFWAACTLTFVVARGWGQAASGAFAGLRVGVLQYVANLTMLSSFLNTNYIDGVYWSLTVELIFYFLVSLLLAYGLLQRLDLFISLWLGFVVLAGLRIAAPNTLFSALLFPDYAPYFAAGMLFYLLQQPQGRTWRRYTLLMAAYLLAVRSNILQASEVSAPFRADTKPGVIAGIITVFFGCFYLIAIRKINLHRHAWLTWLGALTYPLYLLHRNIGLIVFYHFGQSANKYLVLSGLIILMLATAYAIHVLIEKPLGNVLKAYLTKRLLLRSSPTQLNKLG